MDKDISGHSTPATQPVTTGTQLALVDMIYHMVWFGCDFLETHFCSVNFIN